MKKIEEILFSFFNPGVHNTTPAKSVNMTEAAEMIISDTFKKVTELLRLKKASKEKDLCSVTFSALVSRRCKEGVLEWTGFLVFDIDELDMASTLKWQISIDPYLKAVLIFISPRSRGLKIVIRVKDGKPDEHTLYFESVAGYLKKVFGVEIDESGKDQSRLCFLCWDPAAYYNPDGFVEAESLLRLLPKEKVHAIPHSRDAEGNAKDARASVKECPYGTDKISNSTGAPVFSEPTTTGEPRPSDLLNRDPRVHERAVTALKADGWVQVSDDLWRRPGKDVSHSAKYNFFDREGIFFFTNFSSSAMRFGRKGYTDVMLINELEYGGNFNKCIDDLSVQYLRN